MSLSRKDLAARLAVFRRSKGISQDALAEATRDLVKRKRLAKSLSRPYITQIENAKSSPTLERFIAYLAGLDATPAEFFESKAPPDKYHNPGHQQLHEMLQEILETDGLFEIGISLNIEAIFEKAKRQKLEIVKR